MNSAVVLFSGGQDSTVCLAFAKKQFDKVYALSFDYKQKHNIELKAASAIAKELNVKHEILPIDTLHALGGNSLTDINIKVENENHKGKQYPNTFVPGRNLIFLGYACAFAYKKDIKNIVAGMNQVDYSGYPDCRQETINAIQKAISLAMDFSIKIHTPLMHMNKKEIWALAYELNILSLVKEHSHSCYNGVLGGCGLCNACILRNQGFKEFLSTKEA